MFSIWNSLKFCCLVKGKIEKGITQLWVHEIQFFLNSFPHNDSLWPHLENKPFENTVGKVEIARNEQFLLFQQCFLPIWITFCYFPQIWNCRLQTFSVWKSLKFVVWERVKQPAASQVACPFDVQKFYQKSNSSYPWQPERAVQADPKLITFCWCP